MDQTEAIKQLRDLREQFATVPAIKAKWESNRTYCRHTRTIDFQAHGHQKTLSFKMAHYPALR